VRRKKEMKIELGWFYFSIDRHGFYLEIGSVDVPTPILSFGFLRDWWKNSEGLGGGGTKPK